MRQTKERAFPQLVTVFSLMISLIFFANIVTNYIQNHSHSTPTPKSTPLPLTLPFSVGAIRAPDGELIGVSNGIIAFDTLNRTDSVFKQQASIQIENGQGPQAISLWQSAISEDTNDAEALIYLEDQKVFLSGSPYITIVVATTLTGSGSLTGRDNLQGAYVAQKEYNDSSKLPGHRKIRLLIANTGSQYTYVPSVAQQIVSIAKQDKSIVGVIGWPSSSFTLEALPILSSAHIPLISSTASSDQLTNSSQYFFRVVPPNQIQGKAAALFAEQTLHAKRVVVFSDNRDAYSQNLAQDFEQQFINDGNTIVKEEIFATGQTSKFEFGNLIQDALNTRPDLLYFTSPDTFDAANFQDALPTSAHLPVLTGDAGYVVHKNGWGRWYFLAFAFQGESNTPVALRFAQEYSADFNPSHQKPMGYYGYTLADSDTILSYDATSVMLAAAHLAYINGKTVLTPQDIANILPLFKGTLAFQGVSGQISFDASHNPTNKAIVVLHVSIDGHIEMVNMEGCFLVGKC